MSRLALTLPVVLLALAACQDEAHYKPPAPASPPVDSVESIPDAPVSGTIRGVAWKLDDARYIIDRRINYAHTDIKLSSGHAEAACGEIKPKTPTSVWLRLDGNAKVEPGVFRLENGKKGPWSLHYQIREEERWTGYGDAAAILRIRSVGADGKIAGDLAACFGDGAKSCIMGTFNAPYCAVSIDEPVRGSIPVEDAGAPPAPKPPAPAGDAGADGAAPAPHAPAPH